MAGDSERLQVRRGDDMNSLTMNQEIHHWRF